MPLDLLTSSFLFAYLVHSFPPFSLLPSSFSFPMRVGISSTAPFPLLATATHPVLRLRSPGSRVPDPASQSHLPSPVATLAWTFERIHLFTPNAFRPQSSPSPISRNG